MVVVGIVNSCQLQIHNNDNANREKVEVLIDAPMPLASYKDFWSKEEPKYKPIPYEDDRKTFEEMEQKALDKSELIITKDTNYIEEVSPNIGSAMGLMTKWNDDNHKLPYRVIVELTNEIDEDCDTYYHELAHVIDDMFDLRKNITNDMIKELPLLVFSNDDIEYYTKNKGEMFAFLYARTRLNPNKVKEVAPKCYEFMNTTFKVNEYIESEDYNNLIELY